MSSFGTPCCPQVAWCSVWVGVWVCGCACGRSRTLPWLVSLSRWLRLYCFCCCFMFSGIAQNIREIDCLLGIVDSDTSGGIDFEEFLNVLRPPKQSSYVSERDTEMAVSAQAFATLTVRGCVCVSCICLRIVYVHAYRVCACVSCVQACVRCLWRLLCAVCMGASSVCVFVCA